MVPTVEEIEEYLESLEELLFSSLSAATPDLPDVREAVNRLWLDISRYGPGIPSFPEVHLPVLGDFQVPPPPPPPPLPSQPWLHKTADWAGYHPWKASGIAVGVVGAGLLVGYGAVHMRSIKIRRFKTTSNERRQVVVVLGGDTPLALPLVIDLEKKGYIIIASVSTPEAVEFLEHNCQGYVRALVLDPNEPGTIPVFLRSLASTLSRRFPITAAGDPYAHPSSHPYIHSIISLLTLSTPAIHAPLEHISLRNTYLPYLSATHVTPLQVIQALLPLLRTGPARSRDKGKKTIVVCLPATDARVGLPFSSVQAMSAAATLRGVEVLRREVNVAALTDQSESMKNIKVVVADIGAFNVKPLPSHDVYKAMENWSASEKLTYGPAFASISHHIASPPKSYWSSFWSIFKPGHKYGIPRSPTDATVFVDAIVGVVSGGQKGASWFGLGLVLGRIRNWVRGERFSIGAGASTYRVASYLPSTFLDTILNIPHFLVSVRNALLPVQPYVTHPPAAPVAPTPTTAKPTSNLESEHEESGNELSETGSEADVESNSGDGSGVDSSWVSLKKQEQDGGPGV